MSRLSVADIDRLLAAKRAQGYSANSLRIMRAVLRRALGQTEREGLVVRNVAALSTPPRVPSGGGWTLTIEQARALLAEASTHRLGPLVTITLAFGLRRGEALALRWEGLGCRHG